MKHLLNAADAMSQIDNSYIKLDNEEHSVKFIIQDGPIKEFGNNGLQAADMLEYNIELFKSLNKEFPCEENLRTISSLEIALDWQIARTRDRSKRGVEGKSKL